VKQSVLVIGGAGYIGSHTVKLLVGQGYEVTVVDNLTQGHPESIPQEATLVDLSLFDTPELADLMTDSRCTSVLHFAALTSVAESMRNPVEYFSTNVTGSLSLLHAMVAAGVTRIVFSSSAAVYGNSPASPILESDPIRPCNPYGASKAMTEEMLHWFGEVFGLSSLCLRYFNAAGASEDGSLGEKHCPETHLIPCLLHAAITSRQVTVYGKDYDTADGTCVRDFVHVEDLAQAHLLALEHLQGQACQRCYNVGTGEGHSILEVIAMVEEVTGLKVPWAFGERRPGDPASLIASPTRIMADLGWTPRYPDLRSMVQHAWRAAQLN